jgi:hypothetical protein
MSIPSITIRLDFGDGAQAGVIGGASLQQGMAPSPTGLGSGLAGVTQTILPTPLAGTAAAAAQELVPTPMSGMAGAPISGIAGMGPAIGALPMPSLDVVAARAVGVADVPRPEGEPDAVRALTGRR